VTVRILLADDHHIVREGIRLLLQSEDGFAVVGEAGDGVAAVEAALRLRPDILIADMVMPAINGIEVTRQVRKHLPGTLVILLSMYDTVAYVSEALRAGASAYVLKKSNPRELIHAIQQVMAGGRYISPPLDEAAIEEYIRRTVDTAGADPVEGLTERERLVFLMAARGFSNPEIAGALSLSPRTIETHRANMLRKLGLSSQSELVRYAVQHGLVD
jgi:two-component system, NarL family, response regulator NreC